MTWTRLDDRWTERPEFADLSHETRWHYLSMIQFCSRTGRLDGALRLADARRCSDVSDPEAAQAALIAAGLLVAGDGHVKIAEIHEHVPPPSVRNASEQAKIRMQRSRAHKAGDHTLCLPEHCREVTVAGDVTRNTGTGQDGTGQAATKATDVTDPWSEPLPTLSSCTVEGCFTRLLHETERSAGLCHPHLEQGAHRTQEEAQRWA